MTSKSTSKWATDANDEDTAAAIALRKKEKEERRRLKEEKTRKTAPVTAGSSTAAHPVEDAAGSERPSKRRRTSHVASPEDEHDETTHLLRFPTRRFGPCGPVDRFEVLNQIEEGSYGLVSRARRRKNAHNSNNHDGGGAIVALKRLKMPERNTSTEGFPVTGLREIQTLMTCGRHVNVVELLEVAVGDSLQDVYLVLEFVEHDLKSLLDDMAEPFLPSEVKTLMQQLASGVAHLHAHWILHRDLKTSNLLLNNRGELKLADFGMARAVSPGAAKLTRLVVTLWYRAPELLLGTDDYGFEIDVWSLGCVFAELLTRDPLFPGSNEVDQLSKIFALLGTPTAESWPQFRSLPNAKALHPVLSQQRSSTSQLTPARFPYLTASGLGLLSSLLSLNPASRPTASSLLSHAYFTEQPRPKPRELFPTFPSKAGQERRRKRVTPSAPVRGGEPAKIDQGDFAGLFARQAEEERGAGFALRLG